MSVSESAFQDLSGLQWAAAHGYTPEEVADPAFVLAIVAEAVAAEPAPTPALRDARNLFWAHRGVVAFNARKAVSP